MNYKGLLQFYAIEPTNDSLARYITPPTPQSTHTTPAQSRSPCNSQCFYSRSNTPLSSRRRRSSHGVTSNIEATGSYNEFLYHLRSLSQIRSTKDSSVFDPDVSLLVNYMARKSLSYLIAEDMANPLPSLGKSKVLEVILSDANDLLASTKALPSLVSPVSTQLSVKFPEVEPLVEEKKKQFLESLEKIKTEKKALLDRYSDYVDDLELKSRNYKEIVVKLKTIKQRALSYLNQRKILYLPKETNNSKELIGRLLSG
ncbi:hypothetical protein P9112_009097 [Eukaryota sp. TZLM1-RC]